MYSPFVYGQFYCSGIEETLLDCPHSSVNYLLNCRSYEVAGARCIGKYNVHAHIGIYIGQQTCLPRAQT